MISNNSQMQRGRTLSIAIGITMLALLLAGGAGAATITVPTDYTKIQWAIDNATAGDTIEVHSGNYYENVTVNKRLTLRGESNSTTIINGSGSGNVVQVTANGVTIDRFGIQNGSKGIYVSSSKNVISNNVIRDMVGENGGGASSGIFMSGSTSNTITGNTISNITGGAGREDIYGSCDTGGNSSGIYFSGSTNNTLIGNNISIIIGGAGAPGGASGDGDYGPGTAQVGYGIYLETDSYQNRIDITNSVDGDPIVFLYNIDGGVIEDHIITANSNPTNIGKIVLINSRNIIIRNNIIRNMTGGAGVREEYLLSGGSGDNSYGIYIFGSTNNTLIGNNISNIIGGAGGEVIFGSSGSGGNSFGIYILGSTDNTLISNTISNIIGGVGGQVNDKGSGGAGGFSSGIYLSGSTNNTFTGNTIFNIIGTGGSGGMGDPGGDGGDSSGIYISGSTNNTFTGNTIFNIIGGKGGEGHHFGAAGGFSSGIYLSGSTNNTFTGNTIFNIIGTGGSDGSWGGSYGGDSSGIYISGSTNNIFTGNTIFNIIGGTGGGGESGGSGGISSGIYLSGSANNTINGSTINNMTGGTGGYAYGDPYFSGGSGGISSGIYVSGSTNNSLTGSTISNMTGGTGGSGASNGITQIGYSLYLESSSSNNKIYNNIFNNNNTVFISSSINKWNNTKQSGTNIIGGSYLGGNFWANPNGTGFSQTCPDNNKDGICDTSYVLNSSNIDYLPLTSSSIGTEERITTNTLDQWAPVIDGNRIVWQDNRNVNSDIYMYDLSTRTERRITTNTASQSSPDISGTRIVWYDSRNINLDIYLYDLSTSAERRITTNAAEQSLPAISGNRIVWHDNRNGNYDIYTYNLSTSTEKRITTNAKNQSYPDIDGNRIVWHDDRNGNLDIYMYDLSTSTERRITTNTATQREPAISGNRIVWSDNRNGNWDIYMYDLSTSTERRITTNTATQQMPSISGNRIVWHDNRNVNWDIYMYDLSTSTERRITTNSANKQNPSISGTRIVWHDNRNGNWDIYSYNIFIAAPSITVVSPNGGESWVRGTAKTITWTSSGSPGSNVKIELLKGGILNRTINSSTPNDGSQSWTIPTTQTLGSDYKIRITSTSSAIYTDSSNANFTISSSTPSITVVSPNGGESWQRGTAKTITWISSGSPGTNVKIELLKGGILNRTINSSTPNDGSHSWTIPTTQATGSTYKVRVTSTTNAAYTDSSNGNFTISSSTPSITVVSPNGGESWVRGTAKTITWTSSGSPGTNVKVELLKGGVLNRTINSSTQNDGSHSWTIPSTQTLGSDYKVRVTSTSSAIYTDSSNANFTISSSTPSITVVSPNGGESWKRGTAKTITWTSSGSPGSLVKIELLKGGILNRTINSSTPNDGSHSWTIPTTQTIGSNYKVRITSTTNSAYADSSNNNFTIGI